MSQESQEQLGSLSPPSYASPDGRDDVSHMLRQMELESRISPGAAQNGLDDQEVSRMLRDMMGQDPRNAPALFGRQADYHGPRHQSAVERPEVRQEREEADAHEDELQEKVAEAHQADALHMAQPANFAMHMRGMLGDEAILDNRNQGMPLGDPNEAPAMIEPEFFWKTLPSGDPDLRNCYGAPQFGSSGMTLEDAIKVIAPDRCILVTVDHTFLDSTEHHIGEVTRGTGDFGTALKMMLETLLSLSTPPLMHMGMPSTYNVFEENEQQVQRANQAAALKARRDHSAADAALAVQQANMMGAAGGGDMRDAGDILIQARAKALGYARKGAGEVLMTDMPLSLQRQFQDQQKDREDGKRVKPTQAPPIPNWYFEPALGRTIPLVGVFVEPLLRVLEREAWAPGRPAEVVGVVYWFVAFHPLFNWELGLRRHISKASTILRFGDSMPPMRGLSRQESEDLIAMHSFIGRQKEQQNRIAARASDWAHALHLYQKHANPRVTVNVMSATSRLELYAPIDSNWMLGGRTLSQEVLCLENSIRMRLRIGEPSDLPGSRPDRERLVTALHPRQKQFHHYFVPTQIRAVVHNPRTNLDETQLVPNNAPNAGELYPEVMAAFIQPIPSGTFSVVQLEKGYLPRCLPRELELRLGTVQAAYAEDALGAMQIDPNQQNVEADDSTMAGDPRVAARRRWPLLNRAETEWKPHRAQKLRERAGLRSALEMAERGDDADELARCKTALDAHFVKCRDARSEFVQQMNTHLSDKNCAGGRKIFEAWGAMVRSWADGAPPERRRNGCHLQLPTDPNSSHFQNTLAQYMIALDKLTGRFNTHVAALKCMIARVFAYDLTQHAERVWLYLNGLSGAGKTDLIRMLERITVSTDYSTHITACTFSSDTNWSLMLRLMSEIDRNRSAHNVDMTSPELKEALTEGFVGTHALVIAKGDSARRTAATGSWHMNSNVNAGNLSFNAMPMDLQTRGLPVEVSFIWQHPEGQASEMKSASNMIDTDEVTKYEEEMRDENLWCALFMLKQSLGIGFCDYDLRAADHIIETFNRELTTLTGGANFIEGRKKKFLIRAMQAWQLISAVRQVFNGPAAVYSDRINQQPSLEWLFELEPYALVITEEVAWFVITLYGDVILPLRMSELLSRILPLSGEAKPEDMNDLFGALRHLTPLREKYVLLTERLNEVTNVRLNQGKLVRSQNLVPPGAPEKELNAHPAMRAFVVAYELARVEAEAARREFEAANAALAARSADMPRFMSNGGAGNNYHYQWVKCSLRELVRRLTVALSETYSDQEISAALATSSVCATGTQRMQGMASGGGDSNESVVNIYMSTPARTTDGRVVYKADGTVRYVTLPAIIVTASKPGFFILTSLWSNPYQEALMKALESTTYHGMVDRPYMVTLGRPYYDQESAMHWPNALASWDAKQSTRLRVQNNPYDIDPRTWLTRYQFRNHERNGQPTPFILRALSSNFNSNNVQTDWLEFQCFMDVWRECMSPAELERYDAQPLWFVSMEVFKQHLADPSSRHYALFNKFKYVTKNNLHPETRKPDLGEWTAHWIRIARNMLAARRATTLGDLPAAQRVIKHGQYDDLKRRALVISRESSVRAASESGLSLRVSSQVGGDEVLLLASVSDQAHPDAHKQLNEVGCVDTYDNIWSRFAAIDDLFGRKKIVAPPAPSGDDNDDDDGDDGDDMAIAEAAISEAEAQQQHLMKGLQDLQPDTVLDGLI